MAPSATRHQSQQPRHRLSPIPPPTRRLRQPRSRVRRAPRAPRARRLPPRSPSNLAFQPLAAASSQELAAFRASRSNATMLRPTTIRVWIDPTEHAVAEDSDAGAALLARAIIRQDADWPDQIMIAL